MSGRRVLRILQLGMTVNLLPRLPRTPPSAQSDRRHRPAVGRAQSAVVAQCLRNGHTRNKSFALELSRVEPLPHQRIGGPTRSLYPHKGNCHGQRSHVARDLKGILWIIEPSGAVPALADDPFKFAVRSLSPP